MFYKNPLNFLNVKEDEKIRSQFRLMNRIIISDANYHTNLIKSLILAQDERWRHA